MTHKKIIVFSLFLIFNLSCFVGFSSEIIPNPDSRIFTIGEFILSNKTKINYSENFKISGEFLKNFLKIESKLDKYSNQINFLNKDINNEEGYILEILEKNINIYSKTNKGAFYAVQTLRQLLPFQLENDKSIVKEFKVPCQIIKDSPKFKYRGMHLDVGRHMFSVDFIKKYIDALAMLKFNTFHWHLTEDQGWRIEIKKYPKLNTIGSYRDSTLVGHYTDKPIRYDKKNTVVIIHKKKSKTLSLLPNQEKY
jgi:hexosaminidase